MPRPLSQDVPAQIAISQRGWVRYRRVDGAYMVSTGSSQAFCVSDREVPLGTAVTIVWLSSFGMWRIVA